MDFSMDLDSRQGIYTIYIIKLSSSEPSVYYWAFHFEHKTKI